MLFNELKNIFRSDQPHNVIIKLVHPSFEWTDGCHHDLTIRTEEENSRRD